MNTQDFLPGGLGINTGYPAPGRTIKEYDSTSTNTRSCYSNLVDYGANCLLAGGITPPTPVTVVPGLFGAIQPHNVPQKLVAYYGGGNSQPPNSIGYKTLSNTCNSCINGAVNTTATFMQKQHFVDKIDFEKRKQIPRANEGYSGNNFRPGFNDVGYLH